MGEKKYSGHIFYVKKAYDNVWHARLFYKLKNIGITGMMFQYFKNFLSERCICTRVGKTYSSNKTTDMGIPQGSIIAPILFNIIIHDLPKVLSNNTQVAQYADDIAIWVNTTLRKHTNKRVVNHVHVSKCSLYTFHSNPAPVIRSMQFHYCTVE